MRCRLALVLVLWVAPPLIAQPASDAKRPLAVEDLYRLDTPTALALSPDGQHAAYVRQWIDPTTKTERFSLWLVGGKDEKAKAAEKDEPDARAPIYSPDGKWIAFLSTRPRPQGWKQTPPAPPQSDPATDIWLMPSSGGEPVPLAGEKKPYGRVFNDGFYGRIAFSPDGKRLVFVADEGKPARTREEQAANVRVVRPDQGEGYTGYGPSHIWIADLDPTPGKSAAKKVTRLTKDDVWYGDPQWSSDGKSIVVHVNTTDDRESVRYSINKTFDLVLIDVATKETTRLTKGVGPDVSPRFSPDGKRIAFLNVPRKGSHRDVFNLGIVTLGKEPKTEVLFDHHGAGADSPPHPAPAFPLPEDCWDGDHLVYRAERGTATDLIRVDLGSGKGDSLDLGKVEAKADSVAGRIKLRQQLTPPGNVFLRDRVLGQSRVITWDNGDNMKIEGILTTPPEGIAKPPYRLVVFPHGGPHSRSAVGFDFTVQTFAANGYAVFQPNFRGSSGYGQKFIDADRSDFGGGDMRDILTGVEHLVKEKLVDRDRQFVYGVSYGGYMTCWLVGHTNQFRAAVAQNAVTDLDTMWGLSDIPSWTEWEFGGKPWEVPEKMRKYSPLTYVTDVKTPTLVLHSRDDRRCPLPMGTMFYKALEARKVPTEMVIYPGEGHGIKQPRHREDVLRRTLAWFARHDKK